VAVLRPKKAEVKVILKITVRMLGAFVVAGCTNLAIEDEAFTDRYGLPDEVDNCTSCGEPASPPTGEYMVFVNAKLSDVTANYTSNFPIAAEQCEGQDFRCYIGPSLYLYDPTRTCEGAGTACRVTRVGNLWLDGRMGEISVSDQSLKRFTLRDLAWHPSYGLWALSFDSLNDEWGIAFVDVPTWGRTDNRIGIDRYAFRPGPISDATTDDCYWRANLTALGFVGDQLYAASSGRDGEVYALDTPFLGDPRHSVHPSDNSGDPNYYADRRLCSTAVAFSSPVGVAGDVEEGASGDSIAVLEAVDAGDPELPLGRNALYTFDPVAPGSMADARPYGPMLDNLEAGRQIEGLAHIDGKLYGIGARGVVYQISEPTEPGGSWSFQPYDDLGPHFDDPELGLLIRGATRMVLP